MTGALFPCKGVDVVQDKYVEIVIDGKTYQWRDNWATRLNLCNYLKIKNPMSAFVLIEANGPTPELIGAVIAAGVSYQKNEKGEWYETGIGPMDAVMGLALTGMDDIYKIIKMMVDATLATRPTQAGQTNPAQVKAIPVQPNQMQTPAKRKRHQKIHKQS